MGCSAENVDELCEARLELFVRCKFLQVRGIHILFPQGEMTNLKLFVQECKGNVKKSSFYQDLEDAYVWVVEEMDRTGLPAEYLQFDEEFKRYTDEEQLHLMQI